MKYGLPYKGSKNKLAERIVRLLPKSTHLVDLFCGGCAVSHAALLMGKYQHIHINDINWMAPTLFVDALNGKYNNDTRWISREDFFRLKDTDPYVAMGGSFGNNMRDYLYSREIEPLKKAIHYAIFFHDYTLAKELGHDLSFIEPIADIQQRYIAVKRYFGKLGHFSSNHLRGGAESTDTDTTGVVQPNQPSWHNRRGRPQRMQSAEAAIRLQIPNYRTGGERNDSSISAKEIQRMSEYHPLERTTRLAAIKKKKKHTSDQPKPNTESEPTQYHRLQYRERQQSLPRLAGGGRA